MKIRFKSEQHMRKFRAMGSENYELAEYMGMDTHKVIKSGMYYFISGTKPGYTVILESEHDFFDWIEDDPKTLFDIMLEKKAEYDKAFNDYIQSVKENS
uniref:Uncharacterized protein n=1 Tax=Aeromonas phage vB_AdhaM_G2 TaxID=3238786 RepID=A0AB39U015_9CAUD